MARARQAPPCRASRGPRATLWACRASARAPPVPQVRVGASHVNAHLQTQQSSIQTQLRKRLDINPGPVPLRRGLHRCENGPGWWAVGGWPGRGMLDFWFIILQRTPGASLPGAQRAGLSVVHLGRSTCHAISGRGDWSTVLARVQPAGWQPYRPSAAGNRTPSISFPQKFRETSLFETFAV